MDSPLTFWTYMLVVMPAPVWIPVVFAAFAIARKRFSLWMLFALVTAEAVAFGIISLVTAALWTMDSMNPN